MEPQILKDGETLIASGFDYAVMPWMKWELHKTEDAIRGAESEQLLERLAEAGVPLKAPAELPGVFAVYCFGNDGLVILTVSDTEIGALRSLADLVGFSPRLVFLPFGWTLDRAIEYAEQIKASAREGNRTREGEQGS